MTDFGIAGSVPGKSNRDTGCLKGRHRVIAVQLVKSGELGLSDRVALGRIGYPPAVENDEDEGSVHVFFIFPDYHTKREKRKKSIFAFGRALILAFPRGIIAAIGF
jgi:hypothetical protein